MAPLYTIVFDNELASYISGQTVTGRVEVQLDQPTKLKGIRFRIDGKAEVKWHENQSSSTTRRAVTYYAEENYFKSKHYFVGGGEQPITLEPGAYTYPFSYILPPSLPSSFEGKYGFIRYTAKVTLERPWKTNLDKTVTFSVTAPLDLNMFPVFLETSKVSDEKYFCCWCCKKGPLTCSIMIPKTGYICGESIHVVVDIDNLSDVNIHEIKLKFQQFAEFHAISPDNKTMEEMKTLEKFTLGTLAARNSKTVTQTIVIPPLPPTNVALCSIIDTGYEILLEVRAGSLHKNLRASIPIVIGSIPFMQQTNPPIEPFQLAPGGAPPNYDAATSYTGTSQEAWNAGAGVDPSAPTFSENRKLNTTFHNDGTGEQHPTQKDNPAFVPDS